MRQIIIVSLTFCLLSCGGSEDSTSDETTEEVTTDIEETVQDSIDPAYYEEDLMENGGGADECWGNQAVYLNDPDQSGTNIRNSPKGDVVGTLVKDDDDNLAFFMTVIEAENGWLRVDNIIDNMSGGKDYNPGGQCWIHGSVIGVDTRNYGGETIEVYKNADASSEVMSTITNESYGLHILDICGNWVKIRSMDKEIEGWVESKWLCGNTLTTCN